MPNQNTHQFEQLIGLAKEDRDRAAQQLARERQAEQQASEQVKALNRYRREYSERFQAAMQAGIDPASMRNYQQFLASLDQALERADKAHQAQQQQVATSKDQWRHEQRTLSSYDTLIARRRAEWQKSLQRREQKVSDDLVNSRLNRRLDRMQ